MRIPSAPSTPSGVSQVTLAVSLPGSAHLSFSVGHLITGASTSAGSEGESVRERERERDRQRERERERERQRDRQRERDRDRDRGTETESKICFFINVIRSFI